MAEDGGSVEWTVILRKVKPALEPMRALSPNSKSNDVGGTAQQGGHDQASCTSCIVYSEDMHEVNAATQTVVAHNALMEEMIADQMPVCGIDLDNTTLQRKEEEEVTPLASQQGCTDVPGLYIPWS